MDYNSLKKLDEDSMEKLQEGAGPADECICNLFTPPEEARGLAASIKKALGSIGKTTKRGGGLRGSVNGPFTSHKGAHGVHSTKRTVQRKGKCGKCSCDNGKFVLKDSDLSIRITTPDISTICPCPSDCLPDKAKLKDNIQVTIEYAKTTDASAWKTKSRTEPLKTTSNKENDENKPMVKTDSSIIDVKENTVNEGETEKNVLEKTRS